MTSEDRAQKFHTDELIGVEGPEIWTNKLKNGFFPVLDRFRGLRQGLRESCVANQSCRNFFIPAKLAQFGDRPDD